MARILFVACLFLAACHNSAQKIDTTNDSLTPIPDTTMRTRIPAPVEVVKAVYDSLGGISLTYKNVSSSTIAGIVFQWTWSNTFHKVFSGSGQVVDSLRPLKQATGYWTIDAEDVRDVKNFKAWPYKVAFADGTMWEYR